MSFLVTRSYAKMMHPWEGKLKQFKIALETCPKADAIAWLTRGGPISLPDLKINTHSNSAENAEAKSSKQTKDLTKNEIGEASGIDISVQQESPEQPEDLPMNDNDEAGGVVALVQQESTPNSHAFPPIGHRRQSFAGGVLFSVENRVVEMGGDFLHRMMAGTMIFNRFDPFKRMPNGPLRVRSRSIDSFEPMKI